MDRRRFLFGSAGLAALSLLVYLVDPFRAPPEPRSRETAASPAGFAPALPSVTSAPVVASASALPVGAPPTSVLPTSERELMAELRRVQRSDPVRAEALARQGQRLYPDSPDRAERHALLVKSLSLQNRFSEARGEAEKMVNEHPGTPWAIEVERNTGAHPRRPQFAP